MRGGSFLTLAMGLGVAVVLGVGVSAAPTLTVAVAAGFAGMALALAFARHASDILIWTATLPLFINVTGRTLPILGFFQATGSPSAYTRVHLSFGITAGMALALALRPAVKARGTRPSGQALVLTLVVMFSLSILAGYLGGSAGTVGLIFYLQTLTPLAAWFVMANAPTRADAVARAVMVGVSLTLALIMAYVAFHGLLTRPIQAATSIELIIPQYRSYFPAIEMCAVAFAITYWESERRLALITLGLALVNLPYMWSRGGMLMLLVAAAGAFLLRPGRSNALTRAVMLMVGGVAVGMLGLQLLAGGVLGERQANQALLESSDSTRIELAKEGLNRVLANPLLGDQFQPHSAELVGGRVAEFARLFPTHNQYLDYAIRGGVVAAVCLIALLVLTVVTSLRAVRNEDADTAFHGAVAAIFAALIFGNLGELYLTQTWTGSVLFALIGAQCALRRVAATNPSETPSKPLTVS